MTRPFPYGTSLFVKNPLVTANTVNVALINVNNYSRYAVQLTGTTPDVTSNVYAQGCNLIVALTGQSYINNAADGGAPTWVSAGTTQQLKKSFTAAQIKALNTTPIALVAAPGAGFAVVPIAVMGRLTFGTVAYATNTTLNVGYTAGSDPLYTNTSLLTTTTGAPIQPFFPLAQSGTGNNDNEYIANAALNLSVPTGNPTAGDGLLDVYISYIILPL